MIKHIVLWKLNDRSKAGVMKSALEALPAVIPQIREFEVGVGTEAGEVFADISLVSAFDNAEDLQAYLQHPEHQKVVVLIRGLAAERRVADYIV